MFIFIWKEGLPFGDRKGAIWDGGSSQTQGEVVSRGSPIPSVTEGRNGGVLPQLVLVLQTFTTSKALHLAFCTSSSRSPPGTLGTGVEAVCSADEDAEVQRAGCMRPHS